MKTIGLIGGMSWESSLEYYRVINETVKERLGGLHSARCIMYSVDFKEIEELQCKSKWKELTEIMIEAGHNLKKAGADYIVICSNTMHKTANDIQNTLDISVLHIADATAEEIIKKGIRKVGLMGTKISMEDGFYRKRLKERHNIEVIIPDEDDRKIINNVIFNELCLGKLNQSSKDKFKGIIKKLISSGVEGIVLGCTEIPLLIKQKDVEIPIFDTMTIHSVAAVDFALK